MEGIHRAAASLLIEHGHGKPVDRKVVAEMSCGGRETDVMQLTDEELLIIASGGVVTRPFHDDI